MINLKDVFSHLLLVNQDEDTYSDNCCDCNEDSFLCKFFVLFKK